MFACNLYFRTTDSGNVSFQLHVPAPLFLSWYRVMRFSGASTFLYAATFCQESLRPKARYADRLATVLILAPKPSGAVGAGAQS